MSLAPQSSNAGVSFVNGQGSAFFSYCIRKGTFQIDPSFSEKAEIIRQRAFDPPLRAAQSSPVFYITDFSSPTNQAPSPEPELLASDSLFSLCVKTKDLVVGTVVALGSLTYLAVKLVVSKR